jgi:hypothetical protein
MTKVVAQHPTTPKTSLQGQGAAHAAIRGHMKGVAFNKRTGRISGLSSASVDCLRAALPALDMAAQFTALECWLLCHPAPADLEGFAADRLLTNHQLAALCLLYTDHPAH